MDNFNTILVFGAHPDDLEIGMGGTISKLTTLGYKVIMVIATLPNFTRADKKMKENWKLSHLLRF